MVRVLRVTSVLAPLAQAAYVCKSDGCHPSQTGLATQDECFVSCNGGYLWPQPKEARVSETLGEPFSGCWEVTTDNLLVQEMARSFQPKSCASSPDNGLKLQVSMSANVSSTKEEYNLTSSGNSVVIGAESPLGARHAMATLSQLIAKTNRGSVMSKELFIKDAPSKSYRGIMVDTSRHFLPVYVLKRIIRGMGMTKLNVLHLHLSDATSFPLQVPQRSTLSEKGSFSETQVYTPEDMRELDKYAELHGVEILPEIDTPAHVGKGWPEDMLVCHDDWENGGWAAKAVEPPSGQFNIANEAIYPVLGDIYAHIHDIFPRSSALHLGGDEVVVGNDDGSWARCWNSTLAQPILDMIEAKGMDRSDPDTFYKLWTDFNKRSQALAKDAGHSKFVLWAGYQAPNAVTYSLAQQPAFAAAAPVEDVTVMVWDELSGTDASLAMNLAKTGYDVILAHSDKVYLDCGTSGWVRPGGYWCAYNEWYGMYTYMQDARPKFTAEEWERVRGSQVLSWSESADEWNTEQRLWPRAAALAEALWSDPTTGWYEAAPRMLRFRSRLAEAQIPSEALQPTFCDQGPPNGCYLKPAGASDKVIV